MRLLASVLALASAAFSQAPTAPPPIVQIIEAPGSLSAPVKPYAGAKAGVEAVGMSAATGLPQTWTLELHESFAGIEDLDRAISAIAAEPPSGKQRTMLALFEREWSYRPDEAARLLPKARYVSVTIHRIRVGLEGDFAELVQLRKLTNDSINLDRPELAYHVVSGAPAGMYLVIAPLTSLRAFDEGVADVPAFAAPVADARAKAAPKAADVEIGREHLLFRVEPRLSYVSDDFAAADGTFWRGKPSGQ